VPGTCYHCGLREYKGDGVTDHTEPVKTLLATLGRLLSPEGCPWDRQQTVASLARYTVEEAWELLDATRGGPDAAICEELGDVLMLVLFAGCVAEKDGRFTVSDVARRVTDKLMRRHPHVFGDVTVTGPDEVVANWEEIKRREGKTAAADGLPRLSAALPALTQALKLGKAASKQGFDWPDRGGPLAKISEEWGELKEAVARDDAEAVEAEAGDLLFAVVNLCRKTGTDPERALRSSCARFRARFGSLLAEAGPEVFGSLARMEAAWEKAKGRDGHGSRT
jgi:MazG family protein